MEQQLQQDVKAKKEKVEKLLKDIGAEDKYFTPRSQLTSEEIMSFPTIDCDLVREKTRRNKIIYRIVGRLFPKMPLTVNLGEIEYNLIKAQLKLPNNTIRDKLRLPIRLSKGKSEDGREYRQYELFICRSITKVDFFKQIELDLIKILEKEMDSASKLQFMERVFSPEELNGYNFEVESDE